MSRIITVVLGVFLLAYIGYQAYRALYNPVRTVSAIYTEVDDSIPLDGYVLRDEEIFTRNYSGVLEMNLYEGERAANGSLVAVVYADEAAANKSHEAAKLDEQIERLVGLYSRSGESYDLDAANDEISESAQKLVSMQQDAIFNDAAAAAEDMRLQTMIREYIYKDKEELLTVVDELKKERNGLGAGKGIIKRIYAPYAGYFSRSTDGYEKTLVPSFAMSAKPSEFAEKCAEYAEADKDAIGKLITSSIWKYAAVIDEQDAQRLSEGKDIVLKFADKELPQVGAEIVRLSEPENGRVLAVFECNTHIGSFTKMRKVAAQAIVKTYSGLKVPREALRVSEEGQNGVYCLIDSQVKFKPIEIIFEKDSYYIADYDSSDTKSLLLYDEVVVSAKNLENRKVVK